MIRYEVEVSGAILLFMIFLFVLAMVAFGAIEMFIISYIFGVEFNWLIAIFLGLLTVAITSGRS